MTDLALREAERSGDTARALAMRLRAELVTAEQLRLWAYVGLGAAREVLGQSEVISVCGYSDTQQSVDHPDALSNWAAGLPALAQSRKVRKACPPCGGNGMVGPNPDVCPRCHGACTVEREIGQQHLAVTACIGVARAVLADWEAGVYGTKEALGAIKAAERWRDDPTRENADTPWGETYAGGGAWWRELSMWHARTEDVPALTVRALTSAAKHIGEEAVRLAVRNAVVPAEWH